MKYIFVEIEGVLSFCKNGDVCNSEAIKNYTPREDIIALVNKLSEQYEIVLFSLSKEDNRVLMEDFVSLCNINTDEVLLRDDNCYKQGHFALRKVLLDSFDGDGDKLFLKTASVITNNDRFTELMLDEEFNVINVW